jgi:hypothetical protein
MSEVLGKLELYADSLGLSCFRVKHIEGYMYDGTTIFYSDYGRYGTDISAISNLSHELGHYIIASPERRRMPEYGLGSGPESFKDSERMLGKIETNYEESLASIVGMLIEKWAGQDYKLFTWMEHGWTGHTSELEVKLQELAARKILVRNSEDLGMESFTFNERCKL